VGLTVTDPEGLSVNDVINVTVSGANALELTTEADPTTLWPPNHQYVRVQLSIQVSDTCGPLSAVTGVVRSSEPDDGTGDGNTTGDIRVVTAGGDVLLSSNDFPEVTFDPINDRLELRAEREGGGNGRTYTITVLATDANGNQATATVPVVVPHDQEE
jgi:hypothetical protein